MIGPVFTRELAIAPRRARLYALRFTYAAALLVLAATAWLALTGTQLVRDLGDLARFGGLLFQLLAPLQLALIVFFSALLAASAVAQEKDRRTFVLLLLTNLSNSELVLGRLFASLLSVAVMLAAALPVFAATTLFGGVSFAQVGWVFAVTAASGLACGSIGSTIALWREKTFQSLAATMLAVVVWLALGELIAAGALGEALGGVSCRDWAIAVSPWRAVLAAAQPAVAAAPSAAVCGGPVVWFLGAAAGVTMLLCGVAIALLRVWNPPREEAAAAEGPAEEAQPAPAVPAAAKEIARRTAKRGVIEPQASCATAGLPAVQREARLDKPAVAPSTAHCSSPEEIAAAADVPKRQSPHRHVWDNPVLWREVRTWAYGRRMLLVRLAYLGMFAGAAAGLHAMIAAGQLAAYAGGAAVLAPLLLVSIVLVNAQAVTSLTAERDARTLDVLLVTELSPREIVFGKLGGVFYNAKEMTLLPLALCGYLWFRGGLSGENLSYLLGGLAVLYVFAAMLGLHAGMIYANSRTAIAVSLGTVFFLFLGVATCMRIMVAFSGEFQVQLLPFAALVFVGGLGLYLALGARNPSTAIGVAALLCPFATFYAITSLLLGATLGVALVTAAAYGFATAAMLVPALSEFDVASS